MERFDAELKKRDVKGKASFHPSEFGEPASKASRTRNTIPRRGSLSNAFQWLPTGQQCLLTESISRIESHFAYAWHRLAEHDVEYAGHRFSSAPRAEDRL
jgi:hypothetical protein